MLLNEDPLRATDFVDVRSSTLATRFDEPHLSEFLKIRKDILCGLSTPG